MTPIPASDREPILDALRGFAILGILLVNIEVMRGSEWLVAMSGVSISTPARLDRIVQFAIGWLGTGKFLSTLAILFGVGAALIASRATNAAASPLPLLRRRYAWLMMFGIAHMLIFPGDILFLYGLTGLLLLAFLKLRARALLWCSAAALALYCSLVLRSWLPSYGAGAFAAHTEPAADSYAAFIEGLRTQAVAAYTTGHLSDIISAHVWQALLLQVAQLYALPWILALFLLGFAIAGAGVVKDLSGHRMLLSRAALLGLLVGLPVNIGLGLIGPLAAFGTPPAEEPLWLTRWAALAQAIGAPVLAVGYASSLALLFLRRGTIAPLVAVGRMALSAYLLQSLLALVAFAGFRLYDRLSSASALLVVAVIWAVLLVMCPLWLQRFRLGPVEWLWRSLTYGRVEPMRTTRGLSR